MHKIEIKRRGTNWEFDIHAIKSMQNKHKGTILREWDSTTEKDAKPRKESTSGNRGNFSPLANFKVPH